MISYAQATLLILILIGVASHFDSCSEKIREISPTEVNVNCPKGLNEKDYLDLRANYLTLHKDFLTSSSKLEECNKSLKAAKSDLEYTYGRIEILNNAPPAYCPPCDVCEAQEEE